MAPNISLSDIYPFQIVHCVPRQEWNVLYSIKLFCGKKKWLTSRSELLWICGKNGILHIDKANKSFERHVYIESVLAQNSQVFKSKMVFMKQDAFVNEVPFNEKKSI